jgi:hypothetical protein
MVGALRQQPVQDRGFSVELGCQPVAFEHCRQEKPCEQQDQSARQLQASVFEKGEGFG